MLLKLARLEKIEPKEIINLYPQSKYTNKRLQFINDMHLFHFKFDKLSIFVIV